jgi:hypothetical protein
MQVEMFFGGDFGKIEEDVDLFLDEIKDTAEVKHVLQSQSNGDNVDTLTITIFYNVVA